MASTRKLRYGMIGGGRGAFIGAIHRIAAHMDGEAELVAGAFSSDAARGKASAADVHVTPERAYADYREMLHVEAGLPAEHRLDFVVIVTPNHAHYAPTRIALERGFNVILDKPATFDLREARALRALVRKTKKVLVVTHNYTGNAMVKQARAMVANGTLGVVRKVVVEYAQGWLSTPLERAGQKQAAWRTDPMRSGAAGCMGDIGTHAHNLVHYVTGLEIERLCADLTAFVPDRRLDDDGSVLLRFRGGAKGIMHASQICVGDENAFSIRVYGTKAALEWHQEFPNELVVKYADRPREILRRANNYLADSARAFQRTPPGHPEGFLEAFANIYREAFGAIRAEVAGIPVPPNVDFPTIDDGVRGMAFIDTVVKSSRLGARWVKFPRS